VDCKVHVGIPKIINRSGHGESCKTHNLYYKYSTDFESKNGMKEATKFQAANTNNL